MKKMTRYIFTFFFSLFAFFCITSHGVNAEGDNFRVVINPNSNGEPTYEYTFEEELVIEGVSVPTEITEQYTHSRDIIISVYIKKDNPDVYDNLMKVCEIIPENTEGNVEKLKHCSEYQVILEEVKLKNAEEEEEDWYVSNALFQIRGANDGKKEIEFSIKKTTPSGTVIETVEKEINIDTTGPVITLEGGEYIYLAAGGTYQDPGAKCEDDSEISLGACQVVVEDKTIDSNKSGYQYIMYTATDFLGNETRISRKIMVEMKVEEEGISLYWILAGIIVLVVGAALVYIVIKNKEKQRNQSVL